MSGPGGPLDFQYNTYFRILSEDQHLSVQQENTCENDFETEESIEVTKELLVKINLCVHRCIKNQQNKCENDFGT